MLIRNYSQNERVERGTVINDLSFLLFSYRKALALYAVIYKYIYINYIYMNYIYIKYIYIKYIYINYIYINYICINYIYIYILYIYKLYIYYIYRSTLTNVRFKEED